MAEIAQISYFLEKYKLNEYYFVGLKGEKKEETNFIFPWEISENIKNLF